MAKRKSVKTQFGTTENTYTKLSQVTSLDYLRERCTLRFSVFATKGAREEMADPLRHVDITITGATFRSWLQSSNQVGMGYGLAEYLAGKAKQDAKGRWYFDMPKGKKAQLIAFPGDVAEFFMAASDDFEAGQAKEPVEEDSKSGGLRLKAKAG